MQNAPGGAPACLPPGDGPLCRRPGRSLYLRDLHYDGFTRTALHKAASLPYITPVDNNQVAQVLLRGGVGILPQAQALDEDYFSLFEARAAGDGQPHTLAEARAEYLAAPRQWMT